MSLGLVGMTEVVCSKLWVPKVYLCTSEIHMLFAFTRVISTTQMHCLLFSKGSFICFRLKQSLTVLSSLYDHFYKGGIVHF